jgi:hypothetical protein
MKDPLRDLFGHGAHLVRVAAIFAAAVVLFLGLKVLLVPAGFGVYGHFRAGALDDNRTRPLVHAGRQACVECHADVPQAARGGPHERIHCEACHGPLGRHAEDPTAAKGERPDSRTICLRCHEPNVAKPARFPRVEPKEHSGGEACVSCHTPHNPGGEQGVKP